MFLPSMTTQREESGSPISDGCTTPENDETGRVPTSPNPGAGGALKRIAPTPVFEKPDKAAFQAAEARINSEIDAVEAELLATNYHRHTQTHRAMLLVISTPLSLVNQTTYEDNTLAITFKHRSECCRIV